jgi:predicted nucleic acid-binding Zn ribbon protein
MEEWNHWSEIEKANKRKERFDRLIFFLLIFLGGIALWII